MIINLNTNQPLAKDTMKPQRLWALSLITLAAVSCSKNEPTEEANQAEANGIAEAVLAQAAPDGALSVVQARAQAKVGEAITLRGKVGGKMTPIAEAAAILVLADEKAITSCDEKAEDTCPTPWDYCCDESSTIAASTATIQVRDADGKVLRSSLRGLGGLKELSRLVIAGTVDAASTPEALIVNADQIHVESE